MLKIHILYVFYNTCSLNANKTSKFIINDAGFLVKVFIVDDLGTIIKLRQGITELFFVTKFYFFNIFIIFLVHFCSYS